MMAFACAAVPSRTGGGGKTGRARAARCMRVAAGAALEVEGVEEGNGQARGAAIRLRRPQWRGG